MFNGVADNSDPDDHRYQEDDEFDVSDEEQENILHLDEEVRKIAASLKRAAFCSCISEIEVEDEYTLVKNIWGQLQCIVRKPWIKEAVIISAILLFKTGLFMAYSAAKKQGLEIVSL